MAPARRERDALADSMLRVGPDAATLCEGWTTRDLAAHLVVRERRPDAAPGILVSALSSYTDKVQDSVARNDWTQLVDDVRSGPPRWSPTRFDAVDRAVNTIEFFVHHEDVLRAQPEWTPRDLPDDLATDLVSAFRRAAKLLVRKAPGGVTFAPDGYDAFEAKGGEPMVTISGLIGELVLFVYGRSDHATVDFAGDDAAIDALRSTAFGF